MFEYYRAQRRRTAAIRRFLFLSILLAASALAKPPAAKPAAWPTQKELDLEMKKVEREMERVNQASKAMEKDHRKPTKANISGRWTTGSNLCGQEFQLEQDGEKITGRGYAWGCTGVFPSLKVSGTYRGGRLTLKIVDSFFEQTKTLRMIIVEKDGFPEFQSTDRKNWPHLYTFLAFEIQQNRNQVERGVETVMEFMHPFSAAQALRTGQ